MLKGKMGTDFYEKLTVNFWLVMQSAEKWRCLVFISWPYCLSDQSFAVP